MEKKKPTKKQHQTLIKGGKAGCLWTTVVGEAPLETDLSGSLGDSVGWSTGL